MTPTKTSLKAAPFFLTALFGLGLSWVPLTMAAETVPPRVMRMTTAPLLDGVITPAERKEAYYLGKFKDRSGAPAVPGGEAWIGLSGDQVYFAIRCEEPEPEKIKQRIITDEKDAAVWSDDSIDIMIDPGNNGSTLFRLVANTEGTLYDAEGPEGKSDPAWESGAAVATRIGKTAWEIEMTLPMQAMRHLLADGETFAVNIGRARHVSGKREFTSLSGDRLLPFRRFIPLLVSGPVTVEKISLISPRRGPFYRGLPSEWAFEIDYSGKSKEKELNFHFRGPKGKKQVQMPARTGSITLPVAAEELGSMTHCHIIFDGKTLYTSEWQAGEVNPVANTPPIRYPLFEPLVEPVPDGLSRDGFLLWKHELLGSPDPSLFALRSGIEFSKDQLFAQWGKENAIVLFYRKEVTPELLEKAKQHGFRVILWPAMTPAFQGVLRQKSSEVHGKNIRWILDPLAEEEYLDDVDRIITMAENHPEIWGIFAGDETWKVAIKSVSHFISEGREVHPWLDEINQEIRNDFGYGKYGLPTSANDTHPYRWIATYRWVAHRMIGLQRRVREKITKRLPRLKLVSWDNIDGHGPYHLGQWEELFDVATGQLYPILNIHRDRCSFGTRFVKDLTNIKEIWTLPHFEHYPANFTAEQTLDLLSQTFQGGATGLHLFLSDTRNKRAGSGAFPTDRFGAPERWNVATSVLQRLQSPFRVRQLSPDTAIFFSNSSYQGQGGHRPKTFEIEWIYQLLGPRLRGAVRFIDEFQIRKTPELLNTFKSIYVPYAPIVDDEEFEILCEYVANGGNLVVCDPKAFTNRSDGTRRDPASWSGDPAQAPRPNTPGQHPLTSSRLGKGQVVRFSENPLRMASVISNPEWIAFFGELQTSFKAVQDNPVWQFRFPAPAPLKKNRPDGLCLTGNYFEWSLSQPVMVANETLGGSYRLSREVSGEPADVEIPFDQGKLTDRYAAALADNNVSDPRRFALQWKPDHEQEIVYRFQDAVQLATIRLFYQGDLPAGSCEISKDGHEWKRVASWEETASPSPEAVVLKSLDLAKSEGATLLKISFTESSNATLFTLAETDIWGTRHP